MEKEVDIHRLEELSCLSLSEDERERLRNDLYEILLLADGLVSVPDEQGNLSFAEKESVLREDVPSEFSDGEELLRSARVNRDGYLTLPCILGGGAIDD